MNVNLFVLPFVIIMGLLLGSNDSKKNRGIYIFLCCSLFLFFGSMRNSEWFTQTYGIDTASYKFMFENTFDMNWNDFLASVVNRYVYKVSEDDIGFLGLQWFVSNFTHDFQIYSLIVELLFFVPFGILLYRYATSMRQIIFAFVFYVALIHVFILGGGRQMYAIGLDILAVMTIIRGKKCLSIFLVLLGVSIHFSSILSLIPIFVIWLNMGARTLKNIHLTTLLLFPIVLLLPNPIIRFMGNLVSIQKYVDYGMGEIVGGTSTFIILLESLSLFILFAIKINDLNKDVIMRKLYIMVPLFTIFGPLIYSNGSMIRITLYFYIYIVLLFPFAMDVLFKKTYRNLAYIFSICALSLLILKNGGEYYFFWQI